MWRQRRARVGGKEGFPMGSGKKELEGRKTCREEIPPPLKNVDPGVGCELPCCGPARAVDLICEVHWEKRTAKKRTGDPNRVSNTQGWQRTFRPSASEKGGNPRGLRKGNTQKKTSGKIQDKNQSRAFSSSSPVEKCLRNSKIGVLVRAVKKDMGQKKRTGKSHAPEPPQR